MTQAEFIAAGLLHRPTFFGCNTTGNGDISVLGAYPIIAYIPNSPVPSYATNTSTYQPSYTEADQRNFLVAAQTNSTRGISADPNGVDEEWPLAIKSAVVDRARKRDGQSRSAQCQVLFDKYCYADGVVESAATARATTGTFEMAGQIRLPEGVLAT
ncbi:hypothetical protein RQP46_006585 [Phenoliferia psychrophenolica]